MQAALAADSSSCGLLAANKHRRRRHVVHICLLSTSPTTMQSATQSVNRPMARLTRAQPLRAHKVAPSPLTEAAPLRMLTRPSPNMEVDGYSSGGATVHGRVHV